MREFCVLVFLGLNSWLDIKKREISLVLAAMLATADLDCVQGNCFYRTASAHNDRCFFSWNKCHYQRVYGNGGRMDFACSGHSPDARRIFFHAVCSYVDQRGMGRYSAVVIS